MQYRTIVKSCVLGLDSKAFEKLKNSLLGEYLDFRFIEGAAITKEILAEKLCDYFEKLELKSNHSFEKQIENYLNFLDKIVSRKIVSEPPVVSRAQKYYEKAKSDRAAKFNNVRQLLDYNRIMMGLYVAIIDNEYNAISNFDYSISCINPAKIISSMKNEKEEIVFLNIRRQNPINFKELYSLEMCSLILAIIFLHKITGDNVLGE